MKKLFYVFGISGLLFTACVSNPDGERAETTDATEVAERNGSELKVNTDESKIVWTGKKVTATHHGEIQLKSGSIHIEGDKIDGGIFIIDMNSIDVQDMTGEYKGKLEGHLKSDDFFNVEKFPEAKLEITQVEGNGLGNHKASANLTIKDMTKNVTFDVNVTEISETTFKGTADFNIKRADWGITYPGKPDDLISEEINFKVDLDAKK
ncbi:MAG TPA: YceI family protein [Chitinophagales bacterium]|nr:YceI family protein [Chitinophagales bacterium]